MSNLVITENEKSGNPRSEWDIVEASSAIEGFATEMSVNHAETVEFKIDTDSTDYRIDVYRLGYYDGMGARLVDSMQIQGQLQDQPVPIVDPNTGLVDAGNWAVSASWDVPDDAVSGVYIAKLVRQDGIQGENHIPFVVRDDEGGSDIVFKTADETWQAYNPWGQNNFYHFDDVAVSYNRPFTTRTDDANGSPWNFVFGVEHAAIMWLEANGYDVSYVAGLDTARNGASLLDHKAFLSVGHDEYWSGAQRANVEAARDAGVNLLFWGGNDVYWRSRWENSIDGGDTPYRTLVTYKSTLSNRVDDPVEWTGTWRDPDFAGGQPENSLTGTLFQVDSTPLQEILIPYEMSQFRIWRNTDIANLDVGEVGSIGPYLGYEWNDDVDNGHRPVGLIPLSLTTNEVDKYVYDEGASVGTGTSTHSLTLYRAESGALVFSAGSVMWAWGLEAEHDPSPFGELPPADTNVQQAMINLLADMGIQPGSIEDGLVQATASTDFEAPDSASTGPLSVVTGSQITLTGTAVDIGDGVVAVVDVSLDGGQSWHRAEGTSQWSYSWTVPHETGTYSVISRAVDDSVNIQTTANISYIGANGFSTAGYLSANPDVAAAGVDPNQHYMQYGWLEGRDPSAGFDSDRYLAHNQDVRDSSLNPLVHYMQWGLAEGRPVYAAVGNNIQPDGFDAEYYLLTNHDVAAAGVDAYQHYLTNGWSQGRDPNAYFDSDAYLQLYTDVAAEGISPLQHYSEYGWLEGRDPSGQFDTNGYLAINSDVASASVDPLWHFLTSGAEELRTIVDDGILA